MVQVSIQTQAKPTLNYYVFQLLKKHGFLKDAAEKLGITESLLAALLISYDSKIVSDRDLVYAAKSFGIDPEIFKTRWAADIRPLRVLPESLAFVDCPAVADPELVFWDSEA